jgi:hypothetical protein
MRIGWKMHYLQPITWFYDFFLRKTKIFRKFIKPTKKFFWPKQKNTCLMILNDKPNCQVSRILMNPRPILSDSSENDPEYNKGFSRKFEQLEFLTKNDQMSAIWNNSAIFIFLFFYFFKYLCHENTVLIKNFHCTTTLKNF